MQANLITTLLLPLALGIIMFGLGLHLRAADFARVIRMPKPVILGLLTQVLVLPLCAWLICLMLSLPAELAVGVMLLVASPGGATANTFSYLARGDVALNITLTAINSIIILVTLPWVVSLSMTYFMAADTHIPPPFRKVIEVGLIILLPVAIGMWIRAKAEARADKLEKIIKPASLLILLALIALTVTKEWVLIKRSFGEVGLACLLLNISSLGIGYYVSKLTHLPRPQAIAIAFEIGIHNTTLAIFIALSVLQKPALSVPAAIYSLLMYVTAGCCVFWLRRGRGDTDSVDG